MYKKFIGWYEENFTVIMQQNPGVGCEECNNNCNVCRYNLVGLEEVSEDYEAEFKRRMEQYMVTKITEGTLNPENMLDSYLSTLYVQYIKELGIL